MTVNVNEAFQGQVRETYMKLVETHPLTSIKSEEQLHDAQAALDNLLARGQLDLGEQLYLDALSDLVALYEDEHHAINRASDADLLRHFLEAKGITQAQLHRDTGIAKSSISEVLAGKKPFTKQMLRTLADYFQVDIGVLASNIAK